MSFTSDQLEFLRQTKANVRMIGMDDVVSLMLIALIGRGHVLLEGNPGLGKTQLVKRLVSALSLGDDAFGRIQFTPDLMPADITGTRLPQAEGKLEFEKGPVFAELLLADEINRATPKTQSALLEAMAEFQVTVLGEEKQLTEDEPLHLPGTEGTARTPFMVMATQNPVEQEGTYTLPEAQLDRFLFKIRMPFPARDGLDKIMTMMFDDALETKDTGVDEPDGPAKLKMRHQTLQRLRAAHAALHRTPPTAEVRAHILNMVLASTGNIDGVDALDRSQKAALTTFCSERVEYPLGPRAAMALAQAAIGWSAMVITPQDTPDDVAQNALAGLAATVTPVLRHRIGFRQGFDMSGDAADYRLEAVADRHDEAIREFARLTAPQTRDYSREFAAALDATSKTVRV